MLTYRGLAALGVMAVAYVLADLTGLRVLYLLFAALLVILAISYVQVRRTPVSVRSSTALGPNPCVEGSLVRIETLASARSNVGGLVTSVREVLPDGLEPAESVQMSGPVEGCLRATSCVRARKRGLYTITPLRATLVDIFGLMAQSFRLGEESRLTVYPSYIPIDAGKGRESSEMLGASTTGEKGASADFLRIRAYQPGDEVKTIHWRSSAKLGRLMVRELEREETRSATVVLDCEESTNRGREDLFELGVKIAASLAASALDLNMEVKMVLCAQEPRIVEKGRGEVQYHRIMSELASVKPVGTTPLRIVLEGIAREQGRGGTLHVVSQALQEKDVDVMAHLAHRGVEPSLILTRIPAGSGTAAAVRRALGLGGRVGLAQVGDKGRVTVSWAQ